MTLRIAAAAALALVAAAAMMVPAGAAALASASSCLGTLPQVQQVPAGGTRPLAGSTPVLFVHGILSSPRTWGTTSPSSISRQTAAIPGVTAWTFDYAHQAEDWVRKQEIGPDLAAAISCLAEVSGHKVVIIAHSMGGLAAQFALGQRHGQIAADTAELVTIGTPFDGSALLSAAQRVITEGETKAVLSGDAEDIANAVLFEALLSACAGIATHTDSNPCSLLSVPRAPIGTALEENSPQISALPPWPAALPVLDTAGDMRINVSIGRYAFTRDFGDLPVSLASATAHDTAGPVVVQHCGAGTTIVALVHLSPGPCYHSNLPKDPKIIAAVLAAIRANLPPLCPSAAAILQALPAGDREIRGEKGQIKGITCIGPYVTAGLVYSPQIGTVVLLQQEASGLTFLTAGTGPRCTIIRADAGNGIVYIPPQYGHALLCLDGDKLAAHLRGAAGDRAGALN